MAALVLFERTEFESRLARLQPAMFEAGLDGILVSTLPGFRYFTGYNPIIAESPARPWFCLLPAAGDPMAIIPEMGLADMQVASWVRQIRHWPSPQPDDEGVSVLADAINSLPAEFGRIGAELGPEMRLGMTTNDFDALRKNCNSQFVDATQILQTVRAIKSSAEILCMKQAAQCAASAFGQVPDWVKPGLHEAEIHRRFQASLLSCGEDYVRYLAIGSGPGGYDSMCRGPADRCVEPGDVLALDTGSTINGYFCDFDRNFSLGPPAGVVRAAYETLYKATEAGLGAAQPGKTCGDIWREMANVLDSAGASISTIGRMGHGLGMVLTEPPSIHPDDHTVLEQGMTLAIEPGLFYQTGDRQSLMVHEENIVIRQDGAELITNRAPEKIMEI